MTRSRDDRPRRAQGDPAERIPGREEIVAFIRDNADRKIGTREIARAFGLKNADRHELKRLLRELADDGVIARKRNKVHQAGTLPPVVMADITGRDEDGELIAVPTEWDEEAHGAAPKIRIITVRRSPDSGGVGDRVLLRTEESGEPGEAIRHSGRVIKVLDHKRSRVLGIFRALPDGSGRLVPVDKKQMGREITIAARDANGAQDGELIAADLLQGRGFGIGAGRVKERLGSLKSERAVSLIAIHAHNIPSVFPDPALREAEAAKPATLEGREDWRDVPLVTIDPPDAKDHDDAVYAMPDDDLQNRGGFVIHVAIADVSFYVRPGSALDREAVLRGNSVYFPDRVVPMLPERISNDLCSLRPGEPRGALGARIVIGPDGRKHSHTFHRVLMRSAAKLNYAQAQAAIDGQPDDTTGPLLAPVLEPLYAAYAALKKARDGREPLDLDLPERKIVLKSDGTVDRVITPERLDAHKLIEEFMILANVAAAEMLERATTPLIYRVHDEPGLEKTVALREFLQSIDINFPKTGALRPAVFNRVLAQAKGRSDEQLVNEMVLRSQAQAEYSAENFGHFGLNLRRYAHFTSPIRRYADLVVHRGLIRALKLTPGALPETETVETLGEIAAEISATERRAMKAERETTDRLIAHFLSDKIGATFKGRVSGVVRAGLFVKLDDTGADGFVPVRTLGTEYFHYDDKRHTMRGSRSGRTHRLGDTVEVRLAEAAPVAGALRFELLSEGEPGAKPRRREGAERFRESDRPGFSRSRNERDARPEKDRRKKHRGGKAKKNKASRNKGKRK